MNLGERIEMIKRVAWSLHDLNEVDMDLALRQAGGRTGSSWTSDAYSYCVWALDEVSNAALEQLDGYLHSTTHASSGDEPWTTSQFHLFISHISKHKVLASDLKSALSWYGVEGFVAHEDIEPTKEWQKVVEAGLRSCDAMVALLHDGFHESNWCDQEVGFVLGRKVLVIPVRYDIQPYGFLGSIQSMPINEREAKRLANAIAELLLRDTRTGSALTEHMVNALAQSRSWNQSNAAVRLLAAHAPVFTPEQLRTLRQAQKNNIEVGKATWVNSSLTKLEQRFGITAAPDPQPVSSGYSDEEPF